MRLPAGFLPVDDQGFITADVQTPPEASFNRTLDAVKRVEEFLAQRNGVDNVTFLTGFSFLGQGQNTAQAFVTLKDWSERGPNDFGRSHRGRYQQEPRRRASATPRFRHCSRRRSTISGIRAASASVCRTGAQKGYAELMRAKDQLLTAAKKSPILQDVYVEGLAPAPQVELIVDREKAAALGVTFQDINSTISTNLGSAYINDFPNRGRMQRVIVQADNAGRMQTEDILTFNVRNSNGNLVPLSSFATIRWSSARRRWWASTIIRRCESAARPSPAIPAAMRSPRWSALPGTLPRGFGYEWTGQSLQEKLAGSQAPLLLALVRAVGVSAARRAVRELDDSALGAAGGSARDARRRAAVTLRGMPNDVYFTIGLVTIIGLAAKDAILIIEFAKDLRAQGKTLIEARSRPRIFVSGRSS